MTSDLVLRDGDATAAVSIYGAELRSWSVDGHDLLWTGDPLWWDGTSPILFPVVGWSRGGEIRIDGRTYKMPVHGFALSRVFRIEAQKPDSIRLVLDDDEATRAQFPFGFRLAVEYRLRGAELTMRIEVANRGERALPYACGLHPGFRWPFAGGRPEDYAIVFERPERPDIPIIAPGGLFSSRRRQIALDGRRLPLSPESFAKEALCFLDMASRALRFEAPNGAAITLRTRDFPHCAFWSRVGAPLLCIEPWTSHGDPEEFSGDLRERPGMRLLPVGEEARHEALFGFERAGSR